MSDGEIIGVRRFRRGRRSIRVVFVRNSGGSVSGRFMLGRDDTPILDGPTPEAVMALARDVWDALALARKPSA